MSEGSQSFPFIENLVLKSSLKNPIKFLFIENFYQHYNKKLQLDPINLTDDFTLSTYWKQDITFIQIEEMKSFFFALFSSVIR
jgi:hypothetical protein